MPYATIKRVVSCDSKRARVPTGSIYIVSSKIKSVQVCKPGMFSLAKD